ncbi:MAG: amidohydrolase family protein [Victivallaceae bacterium]|nr:amidohydrolase family protein [Victivallaceae bacterium]
MKVIDAHAHLVHRPAGIDHLVESGEFEEVWLMDLSRVGTLECYEMATQDEILEHLRRYPGFFRAFGFVDLDCDSPADIRKLRDLGFCGLKPYKQRKPYGDAGYFPIYEEAQKLGMPILFHTGLIARGGAFSGTGNHAYGSENMRPSQLAGIAEAFPHLPVIAGHLGWPYLNETEQNLYFYANISCDISGYRNCFDRMPALLDRRANDGSGRFFNQKMHFATDQFYGYPGEMERAFKLKHFWELYFELVGGTYYRWGQENERKKFFYENARRIFPTHSETIPRENSPIIS